jgi:hypothetical protein
LGASPHHCEAHHLHKVQHRSFVPRGVTGKRNAKKQEEAYEKRPVKPHGSLAFFFLRFPNKKTILLRTEHRLWSPKRDACWDSDSLFYV